MASVHITKINAVQENIKVFVQNVAFLRLLPPKAPGAASVKTGSYFWSFFVAVRLEAVDRGCRKAPTCGNVWVCVQLILRPMLGKNQQYSLYPSLYLIL